MNDDGVLVHLVPLRQDGDSVRGDQVQRGAALQHQRHQWGELPHAGHVVQRQQPQPFLQVQALSKYIKTFVTNKDVLETSYICTNLFLCNKCTQK